MDNARLINDLRYATMKIEQSTMDKFDRATPKQREEYLKLLELLDAKATDKKLSE